MTWPLFEIFTQLVAGSLIFWPLLNSLAIIALFLVWLFFQPKKRPEGKPAFLLFCLMLGLYLIKIIGVIYSADVDMALFKLQQTSALAVFPLIYAFSSLGRKGFWRTMDFFSVCCALGALTGITWGFVDWLRMGSLQSLQGYQLVRLKGMAPYVFALCCLTSISWQVHVLFHSGSERPVRRLWRISMILLFISFLLLLGNRMAVLLLLVLVLLQLFSIQISSIYKFSAFFVVVLVLLGGSLFIPRMRQQWNELRTVYAQQMIQLDTDSSLGKSWGGGALRLAIWQCAADVVKEYPITGVGTGDAQHALQDSYENRKFYFASRYNKYNAHNQYIQQAVTHGIPGLLLLLACIGTGLYVALRSGNQLALYFWLSFALVCCTESILEINKGLVWFGLFGSMFTVGKTTFTGTEAANDNV